MRFFLASIHTLTGVDGYRLPILALGLPRYVLWSDNIGQKRGFSGPGRARKKGFEIEAPTTTTKRVAPNCRMFSSDRQGDSY